MTSKQKNSVLQAMLKIIEKNRKSLLEANKVDVENYSGGDQAMLDRLIIDEQKVDGMLQSVLEVLEKPDPVNVELYRYQNPNGMLVQNKTAPFGSILIIYESRPDVTIEAAVLAFKAGNKILLKGGKEARNSNLKLVECWQAALKMSGLDSSWIQYFDFPREKTRAFLKAPHLPVDLIVPRGGERLIAFVREHATAPVLVSGRGNNFLYIHEEANWEMAEAIVLNAKTDKISACNALDKVLIDRNLPDLKVCLEKLIDRLHNAGIAVLSDDFIKELLPQKNIEAVESEAIWFEEFLSKKIVLGKAENEEDAIEKINKYSGGHSASILTQNEKAAQKFMEEVDAGAVYHNASTRFTDGGQFGMGAELAISTDKLHHRGPLGLEQLVSNKWFIYGSGQVRE